MEEELKMEALAQEIFDFYDANKNGTLEMKEMKNIIAHIAKRLKVPQTMKKLKRDFIPLM